jgi:hypothetical protein
MKSFLLMRQLCPDGGRIDKAARVSPASAVIRFSSRSIFVLTTQGKETCDNEASAVSAGALLCLRSLLEERP